MCSMEGPQKQVVEEYKQRFMDMISILNECHAEDYSENG